MLNKYLPPVDIIEGGFNVIKENLHMVDISITTYLPHLVNAVKESPLELKENLAFDKKNHKAKAINFLLYDFLIVPH